MLGWGFADLFYKKSNVDGDRYSHLKTAVWVVTFIYGTISQTE